MGATGSPTLGLGHGGIAASSLASPAFLAQLGQQYFFPPSVIMRDAGWMSEQSAHRNRRGLRPTR